MTSVEDFEARAQVSAYKARWKDILADYRKTGWIELPAGDDPWVVEFERGGEVCMCSTDDGFNYSISLSGSDDPEAFLWNPSARAVMLVGPESIHWAVGNVV